MADPHHLGHRQGPAAAPARRHPRPALRRLQRRLGQLHRPRPLHRTCPRLLCQPCNSSIDGCPHLSGCPWADYLDNPPAAHLQLLHPDRAQDRRDGRKIAFTGLDPYTA
ncbi:hypothetical protein [Streptomyces europaeiscabiei]|uniref:hypothetical protein n=1 Tax=Streptomyces europaeiscabiei TaxID=146819 RepID=UPI0038F7C381